MTNAKSILAACPKCVAESYKPLQTLYLDSPGIVGCAVHGLMVAKEVFGHTSDSGKSGDLSQTDRPEPHADVVSNEKTIKWVSEFLWHLEDSSVLNLEAAEAIVNVLKIGPVSSFVCEAYHVD